MNNIVLNLLKIHVMFDVNGYCIISNVFNKNEVDTINREITEVENADVYHDSNGNLRRVERLCDKGEFLKMANQRCIEALEKKFNNKFSIFKDKYNAKPPGGEGFFSHFDGIFMFKNAQDEQKKGWYEYSDFFINILIALDPCNLNNGTIQISKKIDLEFDELIKLTRQNGTPDLNEEFEKTIDFEPIILNPGDIVLFLNTCPHKSSKNKSKLDRRTLYFTYTKGEVSHYNDYFNDKLNSKNETSKALSGDI